MTWSGASRRYAEVRRDANSITTRVNLVSSAGDDLMPPRSWVKAAFDVFEALVDTSRDARLVLAHLVRRMTLDTPYVSASCVEIADTLGISKPRVSKAAKELNELGLARYAVRGKRWEIEPALVQFGNVLRDPEFAAFMKAQRTDDEVPFPSDNARDVRHEPVVIEQTDETAETEDDAGVDKLEANA